MTLGLSTSTLAEIATVLAAFGGLLGGLWLWGGQYRERRLDQARRISAWPVSVGPLRTHNGHGAVFTQHGSDRYSSVLVHARNGSESPAYDFRVLVRGSYLPEAPGHWSPDEPPMILPPGEHEVWIDLVEFPHGGLAGLPLIDFSFRDERGKRWQRLHDGSLGRDRLSRSGKERSLRGRWWALVRAKRHLGLRLRSSETQ
jgi:hypothetical protein